MSVKTTLISGGARGIGRCLVYIFDIIDENELTHTTGIQFEEIFRQGCAPVIYLQSTRCRRYPSPCQNSRISVLINNGGIASPRWSDNRSMDDFDTMSQWQAYLETNLTVPFAVSQACLPYMKLEEGKSASHINDDNAGPCILPSGPSGHNRVTQTKWALLRRSRAFWGSCTAWQSVCGNGASG
ncbi:hypothetical protein F5B22DRAFT_525879 [Xylaria bambusicola]|uniref:uncharacterized protein n=1 Tax=Xylaria bambusicola TaxID=326684 RepID=UPI0020086CCD|nr:uncharacterized protein F5B22DRAFT_525879 [Xylaria bambusicola]KAI0505483.1 hypothetical protein F5B22DRAFT_525879 [Xylaria bambusicola]